MAEFKVRDKKTGEVFTVREKTPTNQEKPTKQSPVEAAKDILKTGAMRTIEQGPTSMRTLAGGPAQTLAEEVKRAALAKAGLPTYSEGGASIDRTPGELVAQMTDPMVLIGARITGLANSLKKPNSADIDMMIKQAADEYKQSMSVVEQTKLAEVKKTGIEFKIAKNAIKSEIDVLDKEVIPQAADKATIQARKAWVEIARDVSKRFGADYQKAIADQKIDTEELHNALGRVVEKAGLNSKPESVWSVSERKIFDYYQKVGKQVPGTTMATEVVMTPQGPQRAVVPTGSPTLDLAKVDKELQGILTSKAGSKYGSGEHILTVTREEVANSLGEASNKIKSVRQKYAPELQMKNEAYNIFQPFNKSGTYDTTKGINFFAKYANGQAKPDEMRLINALKSKSGQGFLDDLNSASATKRDLIKKTQKLAIDMPEKVMKVNEVYNKKLQDAATEADNHLSFLDAMKQNAISDEARGRLIKQIVKKGAGIAAGSSIVGAGLKLGGGMAEKISELFK